MPKRIDIAAQRQMIAEAAISVIGKSGLEGARLRDVARAASVTTGAVTHYFDSKDAMLEATLCEIVERTLRRMDRPEVETARGDVDAFVGRVCRYLPTNRHGRSEWRVWLAFWGRAIADERMRATHRSYYEKFVERMAGFLANLHPGERSSTDRDCLLTADMVIAAIDGVGTRATLEPREWPSERQCSTLSAMLVPVLKAFVRER